MMRFMVLIGLSVQMFILASCATVASAGDKAVDPIVGGWRSPAFKSLDSAAWVFKKDHALRAGKSKGYWQKEKGKYLLYLSGDKSQSRDDALVAEIHSDGRLTVGLYAGRIVRPIMSFRREDELFKPKISPTLDTLAGDWVFVYSRNALFSLAPPFDMITKPYPLRAISSPPHTCIC